MPHERTDCEELSTTQNAESLTLSFQQPLMGLFLYLTPGSGLSTGTSRKVQVESWRKACARTYFAHGLK